MDPRQAAVRRNAHFTRGPRFFREDGEVLFEFVIDATNVVGPRPAHDGDRVSHPEAWAQFQLQDVPAPSAEPAPVLRLRAVAEAADVPALGDEFFDRATVGIQAPEEQVSGQPGKRAYTRRKSPESEGAPQ